MNSKNNFKWLNQDLLSPNEKQRYYYDFGTGEKFEREEVKKQRDDFLEGFNSAETVKKNEKETDVLYNTEPKITKLPLNPSQEVKIEKLPYKPQEPLTFVQYAKGKTKYPWGTSLGGDLNSNEDKELFLDGFVTETKQSQNKTQNKDAMEFGEDSETYKILQDLSKRWYATSDSTEKDRLHEVAEDVRRLARGNNRVKYGTDEIFDIMHKNAKLGRRVKESTTKAIPIKSLVVNPLLAGVSGGLLEPAAFLTLMAIDKNQWNYKYQDEWHPKETYIDQNDGTRRYDGKDLDAYNQKNYIDWIYFDGHLIGADKFGNMNMAYVGKNMGLPEWVYKNFETMDDPKDIFWINKGTSYAESGR